MKPKAHTPPRDDPEQSKRFIDMARELGPDETGKFDRAFQKVASRATQAPVTPEAKGRPASKGRVHKGESN